MFRRRPSLLEPQRTGRVTIQDLIIAVFIFLLGVVFTIGIFRLTAKDSYSLQDMQETISEYCDIVGGKMIEDSNQTYFCVPSDLVKPKDDKERQ